MRARFGTHPSQSDIPLPATRSPGRQPQFLGLDLGPGWPPPRALPLGTNLPGCDPRPIPVIVTLSTGGKGRVKDRQTGRSAQTCFRNTDVEKESMIPKRPLVMQDIAFPR